MVTICTDCPMIDKRFLLCNMGYHPLSLTDSYSKDGMMEFFSDTCLLKRIKAHDKGVEFDKDGDVRRVVWTGR